MELVAHLLSIIFHHALLVHFVTSVSCLNHTLFFFRVWSPRKGTAQARPSLQEVLFLLIIDYSFCVSFFQLDSLASNFQLWIKTISLYSWRFKRKERPYGSNKFLDASLDLHLRKLKFKIFLFSVTDLNSKPCANDLFDKATVDSQFPAVKL